MHTLMCKERKSETTLYVILIHSFIVNKLFSISFQKSIYPYYIVYELIHCLT